MKTKYLFLTVISMLYGLTLKGQTLIVEQRQVKSEESAALDSWTARLDQSVDFTMETYGDFVKELFKAKVDKRGKSMLVAEKILIPEISNLRLDQRALFASESGGTAISFTFSPGYDIHFGQEVYKAEFEKAQSFVKNFVRYHYKKFYNDQIESLQSDIKSRQSDIESNGRKTDKNNKSITSNKSEGETDKTKSKNEKMLRENDSYTADTAAKRRQIADLEDQLAKANESLRRALDFK
ncbi:MAG TPA: hypothetical protein VK666_26245 [Chryseolinea sp.]|nr:hypothetical protein [Chryseolinea sp.]